MNVIKRRGFTLVETAVCVGIMGVLAGIALPVVNDAREEARQAACANRLVEITLGSLQFQEANEAMPPIHTSDGPVAIVNINPANDQNTGALAYILPFIGEQEIFDLMPEVATQPEVVLGPDTAPIFAFTSLLQDPGMNLAQNTQFPSVICPSNAELLDKPISRLFYSTIQATDQPGVLFLGNFNVSETAESFGRTSYSPSIGGFHIQQVSDERAIDISLQDAAGPMRNRITSIHTNELGDGASNTICWSESLGYDLEENILFPNDEFGGASFALYSTALITGSRWIVNSELDSILFGDSDNSLPWVIGSNHIDGHNVTFCDGSVRFISDRTSQGVMASLGCGNDGWVAERNK